jgi:GT2 family glycosyltransferase
MSIPTLSICIVTYQARDYLKRCLDSIHEGQHWLDKLEIIVVDNASIDGTVEMIKGDFPQVHVIENLENRGFSASMNQALRIAHGRFLLLLNPDTIVFPATFDHLIHFIEAHPEAGIYGPKVLNPDGTLQKPCRRGESRPWAVISYFTGLSRLFPKSKFFSEYLMSYLDEDETHEVAGISGSCMLIRCEVVDQIGLLDERFFAYQEDADYCFRARQAGWKVFYVPAAKIIHYGGLGGSHVHPYRSTIEWHRSYWLYYRKNLAKDYFSLFNWIYYMLMGVKLLVALVQNFLHIGKFSNQ